MRGAGNCWSGSPSSWYNTLWLGPLSSVAAIASVHLMRGLLQLSKKGTRVCSLEQMVLTCIIVGVLMKCSTFGAWWHTGTSPGKPTTLPRSVHVNTGGCIPGRFCGDTGHMLLHCTCMMWRYAWLAPWNNSFTC